MDEATALLLSLDTVPADAPTACAGWRAHELVAHLAAGAKEMADLVEEHLAGGAPRPTAPFAGREAPFRAMEDAALRDVLVAEALRLGAATEALAAGGGAVGFSNRSLTAGELALHGRSEAVLHRWDLVGDDGEGARLLAQPELTAHAVTVLNDMLEGSAESVAARAQGLGPLQAVVRSPGQAAVCLRVDGDGARLEALPEHSDGPGVETDAASRLLLLWGRRPRDARFTWDADGVTHDALARFLGL